MSLVHKLNRHKIQTNIGINQTENMEYCGMIINLTSKEITAHYTFKPNTVMHYRFKLWNKPKPLLMEG